MNLLFPSFSFSKASSGVITVASSVAANEDPENINKINMAYMRLFLYLNMVFSIESVNNDDLAVYRGLVLSYDDLVRQFVINSLMCNFVLNFTDLKEKYGIDYHIYFFEEHKELKGFFEDGFLNLMPDRLEITELGRTFVRNIAMTYDIYLKKDHGDSKSTFSRTI